MKRLLFLWFVTCLLAGCASGSAKAKLPYDAWYLGFSAPPYMSVWVETADVEDIHGRIFQRAGAGTASLGYAGSPAGWSNMPGGLGRHVIGADLPKRIYVRWQSLVEPQTYEAILEVPEQARQLMLTQVTSSNDPTYRNWRKAIAIGLAPGGFVKMWVTGPVGKPVEIRCQKAEIAPKGPDQGKYEGRYVTLPAKAKEYISRNPPMIHGSAPAPDSMKQLAVAGLV